MNWPLAWRLARRELRGGLAGFRVLILCLALGVAAIAAVGLLRSAIQGGLADQGAVLLGGDAQMNFTYRFASDAEKAWMADHAVEVSEIVDFRSLAVAGEDRALTQVKAVDDAWPLVGAVGFYVVAMAITCAVVTALCYPVAASGIRAFGRAMLPTQLIAASCSSSIASLPAMVRSADALAVAIAHAHLGASLRKGLL